MKNGKCSKCGAENVHLMNGNYADLVGVPIGWAYASAEYYICVKCGFMELYIKNPDELAKIAEKWQKVSVRI